MSMLTYEDYMKIQDAIDQCEVEMRVAYDTDDVALWYEMRDLMHELQHQCWGWLGSGEETIVAPPGDSRQAHLSGK